VAARCGLAPLIELADAHVCPWEPVYSVAGAIPTRELTLSFLLDAHFVCNIYE